NSAHGNLPMQNEKRDRVQDRFDFTPEPGVGFVLATNRTGAPAFRIIYPRLYRRPKKQQKTYGCAILIQETYRSRFGLAVAFT
ncbi:hypothetical protein KUCAC02_004470, partial [Chaenocephalus aceratus]